MQAFAATSIVPGTTYYMRNVANGKYLTVGGWWGTHAMDGESAIPLLFENAGGNDYRIKSTSGYFMAPDIYIDKTYDEACLWTAESLAGGKFLFKYGQDQAMALDGDYVNAKDLNASDTAQQWDLLTREEMISDLGSASIENPLNATFLLPGASIVNNSSDNEKWVRSGAGENALFEYAQVTDPDNENWRKTLVYRSYNEAVGDGATTAYTITNTAEGLPAGSYILSGFVASDGAQPAMTVNGATVTYTKVGDNGSLTPLQFGSAMFSGNYEVKVPVTITDGKLEIKFVKGSNTNATTLYFGNFTLLYAGNSGGNIYDAMYKNVKAAMDEAESIVTALHLTSYDNSVVEQRWNNHTITGDGTEEVRMTYQALAVAVKAQTVIPADMTYAILNPSFELGDWGWSFVSEGDTRVAENAEGKTTEGGHGKYLYNTWVDGGKGNVVSQILSGMPAGKYVATTKVSAPAAQTVYLFANSSHNGVTVPEDSNEGTFRTVELEFELEQPGEIKIGVVGGDDQGNFVEDKGTWFRADNITLTHTAAAGVDSIDSDFNEELPTEYYNLQGMKIANPSAGQIYIVKQGNVAKKVRM